jgi:hypothetical protein
MFPQQVLLSRNQVCQAGQLVQVVYQQVGQYKMLNNCIKQYTDKMKAGKNKSPLFLYFIDIYSVYFQKFCILLGKKYAKFGYISNLNNLTYERR